MIVWTNQPYSVYEQLMATGSFSCSCTPALSSMAKQKAGGLAPLIHTDRGAAYTSKAFNHYLASNNSQHSYSAPGTPADNAVMEHWWADFKSIWLAHSPQPQTFEDLEQLVTEGIDYFTHSFISGKRNWSLRCETMKERMLISSPKKRLPALYLAII